MTRKARTAPRKLASQQRSRITVDALLEATARILVKDGYDTASTNRIAATAGVSIGSLYQYFPSKEALVAATIDRHMDEMMGLMRVALADVMDKPIDTAVRELITVMIDAHRVNPKLHRVLHEQIPRTGRLENIEALDREAYTLVRNYFEAHRQEIVATDLDMAAFISVKTVETLTHTAVLHRADIIAGRGIKTFIDEVTKLVVGYLKGN